MHKRHMCHIHKAKEYHSWSKESNIYKVKEFYQPKIQDRCGLNTNDNPEMGIQHTFFSSANN